MRDDSLKIDYSGFFPEARLQTQTHFLADRIQAKAPSDSFIRIHLQWNPSEHYRCTLRIQSSKARFVTEKRDKDALVAMLAAEKDILSELEAWKSQRLFLPEGFLSQSKAV